MPGVCPVELQNRCLQLTVKELNKCSQCTAGHLTVDLLCANSSDSTILRDDSRNSFCTNIILISYYNFTSPGKKHCRIAKFDEK